MPDQNQPQGGQGQRQHKVTKQFTDNNGRVWRVGENFTGNAQAIQAAKSAGFTPKTPVIEIAGICAHCRKTS